MSASMATRQDLVKIKSRALRARVWFRILSRVERAIIDLTIKCVEKVRSTVLAGTIEAIVNRILRSLEDGFMTRAERVGSKIVEDVCAVGKRWGSEASYAWRYDKCFFRFLGVNALNTYVT